MKTFLTEREHAILVLSAQNQDNKHPSNANIAQRLGLSVGVVKSSIHRACIKLGARNRYDAIVKAVLKGEIKLNEIYSIDEIVKILSLCDFDTQRRVLHLLRKWLEYGYLTAEDLQITDRRRGARLTEAERDVVILLGHGFTNNEIADRLCISTAAVKTFLYRACSKLGVNSRADLFVLAIKKGEIAAFDLAPPDKLIPVIAAMGAVNVVEIVKLLNQKLEQTATKTGTHGY